MTFVMSVEKAAKHATSAAKKLQGKCVQYLTLSAASAGKTSINLDLDDYN